MEKADEESSRKREVAKVFRKRDVTVATAAMFALDAFALVTAVALVASWTKSGRRMLPSFLKDELPGIRLPLAALAATLTARSIGHVTEAADLSREAILGEVAREDAATKAAKLKQQLDEKAATSAQGIG